MLFQFVMPFWFYGLWVIQLWNHPLSFILGNCIAIAIITLLHRYVGKAPWKSKVYFPWQWEALRHSYRAQVMLGGMDAGEAWIAYRKAEGPFFYLCPWISNRGFIDDLFNLEMKRRGIR